MWGHYWEESSLCAGWTVHDVLAHLVDNAQTTRVSFLLGLARARLDFDRQNARGVERERMVSPAQTLDRFRGVSVRRSAPPAHLDTRLVEEIVHGEDIRRPLGITRCYPRDAVIRALRRQARTPVSLGGARELLTLIRITTTDADVSIGNGPNANGTALSLLLATTGRSAALDDLDGPGADAFAKLS